MGPGDTGQGGRWAASTHPGKSSSENELQELILQGQVKGRPTHERLCVCGLNDWEKEVVVRLARTQILRTISEVLN